MKSKQQEEVDINFQALKELFNKNEIPSNVEGQFALMKNAKIEGYFSTWEDAEQSGTLAYKDKLFSVQEISHNIINLGYYSYYAHN